MKKLIALALTTSLSAVAATDAEIQAGADNTEQLLNQQQQLRDARDQAPALAPSGADPQTLPISAEQLIPADGTCIEFDRLEMQGNQTIDEWDLEVIEAPFVGKCITPTLAASVLGATTNYYLERGFITTRTYLPNQDLSRGVMRVVASEGRVQSTVVDARKPIYLPNVTIGDDDNALSIRDLEQTVDQLNTVPGNDVKLELLPGDAPGETQVVLKNDGKPGISGRLATDNTGSKSTGRNGASVSLKIGDLVGQNEVISLYYRENIDGARDGELTKNSHSSAASVSFPDGYNTYKIGFSKGDFATSLVFPTTNTILDNVGSNISHYAEADRVFFRDQRSKHSIKAKLKKDSVESYIGGQRIDVSSRSLKALELSSNHVWGFGDKVLIVNPEIAIGLDEVNNLPAGVNTPVENPQAEYLRYKLSLNYTHPFKFKQHAASLTSRFVGQLTDQPLYSSQQISIGGAASIRGSHFVTLSGDEGYYSQNTVNVQIASQAHGMTLNANYFLGYDVGRVRSNRAEGAEGDMKAGVIGASWNIAPVTLAITRSLPIHVDGRDEGAPFTAGTLSIDF